MENTWNLLQNDVTLCPNNWGMRRESALFYRVYYILGGEAWCKMEAEAFPLVHGTLYILPIMTPYDLWQNPEDPLQVVWFHVEPTADVFPELVALPVGEETAIFSVLQALQRTRTHSRAVRELAVALLALVGEERALHGAKTRRLDTVDRWIEAHMDGEIRVEELAALAGLERSYFSREFKRVMQVSPQKYILAKKMSAATRALRQGASVAQAAAQTGYLSEKAFSRAFKAYMEITPREYRKSHIVQP